jgi:hypothetical protein
MAEYRHRGLRSTRRRGGCDQPNPQTGISDDKQQLCFAIALWNGRDPILKERLFGLTNSESNHGEDVKEYYFYLDSTPTHSYSLCLRHRRPRFVPSHEGQVKKQIGGNHQGQIDNGDHVDVGPGKAIARDV